MNNCNKYLKDAQDLCEKRKNTLTQRLQKEIELIYCPFGTRSMIREEIMLLERNLQSFVKEIEKIKKMIADCDTQIQQFRTEIDSLRLCISSNKFILYEQLSRYQSLCQSIIHLIDYKNLEIQYQIVNNQLYEKQSATQYYTMPNTLQRPLQPSYTDNRRYSLIPPAKTPARNIPPERFFSTSAKPIPSSRIQRLSCFPERTTKSSRFLNENYPRRV